MQTCHTMCPAATKYGSISRTVYICRSQFPVGSALMNLLSMSIMSIYGNHKQAVSICFNASFCLSVMCLILHSTSADHTSSIVLSKDIKLSNKLAASFKSPLLTAVLAAGSFVGPCVPSCGLSNASVPDSGESYACHCNEHGV